MVLVAILTAGVAFVLCVFVKKFTNTIFGIWAGITYLLLPAVLVQTTLLMTEPLLSLTGLLALYSLANFLRGNRTFDAVCFGIWASACILTKGDGIVLILVVPLAFILMMQPRRLFSQPVLYAGLVIAVLCVPFLLLTFKMARQGWEGTLGLHYFVQAVPAECRIFLHNLGWPLLVLAGGGAAWCFRKYRLLKAPLTACLTAYIITIPVFQAIVPTGVEPRKLIAAFPALLFFAAVGIKQITEFLARHMREALATALALFATTACWAYSSFKPYSRPAHGYRAIAGRITTDPALKDAVVMVSGNPIEEGVLIAEIASREARPSHYVLRGSKILWHADWTGRRNRQLFYKNPQELNAALEEIPVNAVVIAFPPAPDAPADQLLARAITDASDRWAVVYSEPDPLSPPHTRQLCIYQNKAAPKRVPRLQLDLDETLGRKLQTPEY
jgi:hypothetical protein